MEGTTSGSVTSTSLQRMWENKAEQICREILDLAGKFIEESGLRRPDNGGLVLLLKNLGGAQANDAGLPLFDRKYVTYPQFKKEWWAYRRIYHAYVTKELVCRTVMEKSLGGAGQ